MFLHSSFLSHALLVRKASTPPYIRYIKNFLQENLVLKKRVQIREDYNLWKWLSLSPVVRILLTQASSVPFWAIYCMLGNFSKPVATTILPKWPTFLGNFLKVSKSFIFLVKSFWGNFYRHLATFYWSHCRQGKFYGHSWSSLVDVDDEDPYRPKW